MYKLATISMRQVATISMHQVATISMSFPHCTIVIGNSTIFYVPQQYFQVTHFAKVFLYKQEILFCRFVKVQTKFPGKLYSLSKHENENKSGKMFQCLLHYYSAQKGIHFYSFFFDAKIYFYFLRCTRYVGRYVRRYVGRLVRSQVRRQVTMTSALLASQVPRQKVTVASLIPKFSKEHTLASEETQVPQV